MIGTVHPEIGKVDARTLPRVFSNDTRCQECGQSGLIRVALHGPGIDPSERIILEACVVQQREVLLCCPALSEQSI